MIIESVSLLHLRIVAEADPGALQRVLERFQNLNVLPRRVIAELSSTGVLHIQVDIVGISDEHLSRIAAKISQAPSILNAFWHRA
jgi:(p)ppGpp synthase/HD superfamily hydrolase